MFPLMRELVLAVVNRAARPFGLEVHPRSVAAPDPTASELALELRSNLASNLKLASARADQAEQRARGLRKALEAEHAHRERAERLVRSGSAFQLVLPPSDGLAQVAQDYVTVHRLYGASGPTSWAVAPVSWERGIHTHEQREFKSQEDALAYGESLLKQIRVEQTGTEVADA